MLVNFLDVLWKHQSYNGIRIFCVVSSLVHRFTNSGSRGIVMERGKVNENFQGLQINFSSNLDVVTD